MLVLLSIFLGINTPYYFDPRIHNLGNIGPLGRIHANIAPTFTKIIDENAYNKRDIRKEIYSTFEGTVIDLCCGTGFSTCPKNVGIDTSTEMIRVARKINPDRTYYVANSEFYGECQSYDIVSCMFAFHEMPESAHIEIINNAFKLARKKIIIVDISTTYKPSQFMLSGEPYLLDYLETIDNTLIEFNKTIYIEDHIDVWEYNFI